jgi:hypothetical protein
MTQVSISWFGVLVLGAIAVVLVLLFAVAFSGRRGD